MAGPVEDFLSDVDFESVIKVFEKGGWFQYFFPFLLVYAIVLTILEKVKIFEDSDDKSKKPIRIVIATVFSLVSVAFPVNDSGVTLGDVINQLFPGVSVFAMGILGLYIITAMMGSDLFKFLDGTDEEKNKYIKWTIGGLGVIWVIAYFGDAMGFFEGDLSDNIIIDILKDPMLWIIVLMILLFSWINKDNSLKNEDDSSNEQ